ncbi:hypothetical protein GCM10023149_26710 [Mucilaginibacter gynuensis]|uniref:Tetratricopeptide repeat protein n=1 Tax=Mucilaginibacter gynuensis TaxID=1302236 RepID=A0ABP8GIQ7_9SPHI
MLLAACSLEKKSGLNRRLQNLTAHYNILFNAREILKQKQDAYAASFVDNYTEILSVYQDTAAVTGEDKDLAAAISKAQTIINFKEQSNYLGDAYLVLGKANYLGSNYFNAVEYFDYVIRSYTEKPELVQEALVWKARALLYLKQQEQAKLVLDTAIQNINPKKNITADVYASKLQYDIVAQEYADAEQMAVNAIKYSNSTMQRLRWTFILAQLQELNQKPADAIANYTRIVRSNASFGMAFNADLNRIRIEDKRDGIKISRVDRLRSLLKNQNNKEFTDQIYYQIAQIYYTEGDVDKAIDNYKLSTKYSLQNQNQKGLSYLRLADVYFKNKADYVNAKMYYDSTLANLSPNYPGYITIKKKSDNLQLLTDNLKIIAHEDTLQMLAGLSEDARKAKIDEMVNRNTMQQQQRVSAPLNNNVTPGNLADYTQNPQASTPDGNSFYFYNNKAVSQGFSVFKRKWGNRRLEDNWRRSQRSNSNLTVNNTTNDPDAVVNTSAQKDVQTVSNSNYRQELVQSIPYTEDQMLESNLKIYNAYLDIGNFYRDILEDKKEAIANYELLLARFPDHPNKSSIYYNLYRLYSDIDVAKAEDYKNRLLKEYGDTPYAKVILDPEYAKHVSDADAEFNALYNQVYDLYAKRKYTDVIQQAEMLLQQYPLNKLSSQLEYLKIIANGHQVKLPPFKADLIAEVNKYPDDQLVTPLVKQHLAFIESHTAEIAARRFALLDDDYIPFLQAPIEPLQPQFAQVAERRIEKPIEGAKQKQPSAAAVNKAKPLTLGEVKALDRPVIERSATDSVNSKPADVPVIAGNKPVVDSAANAPAKPKKAYPFTEADKTNYYFVINVADNRTSLSSSRFGVGQFNRSRYQGVDIKHQLKDVGANNQLIFVGRFYSLEAVKIYARSIVPLMPDIMKVPKEKYSFFIITQQNLDKLTDKKTLDNYVEYYQDNF